MRYDVSRVMRNADLLMQCKAAEPSFRLTHELSEGKKLIVARCVVDGRPRELAMWDDNPDVDVEELVLKTALGDLQRRKKAS